MIDFEVARELFQTHILITPDPPQPKLLNANIHLKIYS